MGFGANSFGGGVKDGVQTQLTGVSGWTHFIDNFLGKPGPVTSPQGEQGQAISAANTIIPFHFPTASLAYFQLVFAAITPLLFLGKRARTHQVQRLVSVGAAVDDLRVLGGRLPTVGWRLLRPRRCARLLRWLRHPYVGWCVRVRGCLGPRTPTATGPTTLPAQQPGHGGSRCRNPVARLERLQRWRPLLRRGQCGLRRGQHEPGYSHRSAHLGGLGRLGLQGEEADLPRCRQRHDLRTGRHHTVRRLG